MIIRIIIRSSKSAILSTTQILVISWVDFWRILVDCISNDIYVIIGYYASSPFLSVTRLTPCVGPPWPRTSRLVAVYWKQSIPCLDALGYEGVLDI